MKPHLHIKKLGNKHKRRVSSTCRHCGTVVEATEDSLKWEHDRDGDLSRETCPNDSCKAEIFFLPMTPTPEQNAKRIAELRKDYAPIVPPPCPVCGGPRDSICAAGMGRVTYCCSSEDAEPMGKGDRFDECMEHFSKSRYETVSRDSRVIELCDAYEQLRLAADGMRDGIVAARLILWMAERYAEAGGSNGPEMRDFTDASERIEAAYRAASNPSNSPTDSRDNQG